MDMPQERTRPAILSIDREKYPHIAFVMGRTGLDVVVDSESEGKPDQYFIGELGQIAPEHLPWICDSLEELEAKCRDWNPDPITHK